MRNNMRAPFFETQCIYERIEDRPTDRRPTTDDLTFGKNSNNLDNFWSCKDVMFDWTADLVGIGDRSECVTLNE